MKEVVMAEDKWAGVVSWFDDRKGFGFIKAQDGTDVFVHYSAIKADGYRTLNEGDKVEFSKVVGQKGTQAADVVKVDQ